VFSTNGNSSIGTSSNQKQAVQAILLVGLVGLFNLALCVTIFTFVRWGWVSGPFPALVLFLSFALSIGIILIKFLGESIDKSDNEWVKKIGVTPIMTIVAVLISLIASFLGLADKLIPQRVETPADPYVGHFMLAKIGITCSASESKGLPQATALLVVLNSPQKGYISKIKALLAEPDKLKTLMRSPNDLKYKVITPDSRDETYALLTSHASESLQKDNSLQKDMSREEDWVAYTVPVRPPTVDTTIPVPTIFEDSHTTRLFVITKQSGSNDQPELTRLTAASSGNAAATLKLNPLFEAAIVPRIPEKDSFLTEFGLRVFSTSACWQGTL
jgi:hypothetical protein